MDIERLKEKYADGFQVGDHIVVQEKIDGANFSFRYDEEKDSIKAFSRKRELEFGNNLRGAWEWSQKIDNTLVKNILGNDLVLFGEWLVSHTIVYPDCRYQNAYFYDVWDSENGRYLSQVEVFDIVNKLGLTYVPVFYNGEFISWDHLREFVGRTGLGGSQGEGIVVKNMTRLNDPNTRLPFYTKIVGDYFSEKKSIKKFDDSKLEQRSKNQELVNSVVTEARVRKLLHKMVDEDLIPINWDENNMAAIAKTIGKEVYSDCMKEEPDTVELVGKTFGKLASGTAMKIVKTMINSR
uniref:RNA ligase family protein n=1 Tax=Clostridium sp. 12(A) TaxID=1163671 RepID=UPI0004BC829A|nr:RNA ligase family protein [Clostridium sp. 12(A)]